jgi:phage tail-like protein
MAGIVGEEVEFFQAWAFVFEIEGIDTAGFESAGPLKQTIATVEQHEGGARTVVSKRPGKYKTEKITLTRGASSNTDLEEWWLALKRGEQDLRNCSLRQQRPDGTLIKRWNLPKAFLVSYDAGTRDAKKENENAIETVELEYADLEPEAA